MSINIRVTALIIENDSLLLLQQNTESSRKWSLPGGKVEEGETLEAALLREVQEETGLTVTIGSLLYLCDNILPDKHLLHITFLCSQVGGELGAIAGLDTEKINSVEFVPISQLATKGFSETFINLVKTNFPNRGQYLGAKANIGL